MYLKLSMLTRRVFTLHLFKDLQDTGIIFTVLKIPGTCQNTRAQRALGEIVEAVVEHSLLDLRIRSR